MKEKRDANGLAILAGVSGVYVIDIDVAAKGGKRPGTELWQQLVEIHGEPETLKARTGSGGLHYVLQARLSRSHVETKFSRSQGRRQDFWR